jgi:hypothetical protein
MVVQRATVFEYFQIEQLREAYFRARDLPVQRWLGARWAVASEGSRVLAAVSWEDAAGERVVHDFYRVDDRAGIRALKHLGKWVCDEADRDGIRLVFGVDPRNAEMLNAFGWKLTIEPTRHEQKLVPVAVMLIREPCRPQ